MLGSFGKKYSMPINNPLGMPISNKDMRKMPKPEELLGLKIIAEINKLGPAPRAYSSLLEMAENSSMDIDEGGDSNRQLLSKRFEKIEKALPSIPKAILFAQDKLDKTGLFVPSKSNNVFKPEG